MEIKVAMDKAMPCEVKEFCINGKKAKIEDFGNIFAHKMDCSACLNMEFEPIPYGSIISKRYKLTEDEYEEVCTFLKKNTFINRCCKCFIK